MARGKRYQDSRTAFLSVNISRAKNRKDGKEITLTPEQAYAIGEQQGWRCAISGVKLQFTRGGTNWGGKWCNPLSCSIDRKDNTKGYTKGNCQLVTWAQNKSRGSTDLKSYKKIMGYK
jgi:hypothetical protein